VIFSPPENPPRHLGGYKRRLQTSGKFSRWSLMAVQNVRTRFGRIAQLLREKNPNA
jgi:hypothetical protein